MSNAMVTVQALDDLGQPIKPGAGANAAFADTTTAIPANASTKVVSAGDRIFSIVNSGAGNANLSFGKAAVVDQGFPADAASAIGRQGGGVFFDNPVTTLVDIFAISALGTSIVVLKG